YYLVREHVYDQLCRQKAVIDNLIVNYASNIQTLNTQLVKNTSDLLVTAISKKSMLTRKSESEEQTNTSQLQIKKNQWEQLKKLKEANALKDVDQKNEFNRLDIEIRLENYNSKTKPLTDEEQKKLKHLKKKLERLNTKEKLDTSLSSG